MARKVAALAFALGLLACAALAWRPFGDAAQCGSTPASELRDETPDLVVAGERASSVSTAYSQSHRGQWGDIPDLVVVAERASSVTTVYTQSHHGKWGDIPDQIVIGTAPAKTTHPTVNAPGRRRESADLVVTVATDTRQVDGIPVAAGSSEQAQSRP